MPQHALRRTAGDPDPLLLNLLQRRITCGRTPAQVADAMGVNVQSVYELERKIRAGGGVLLGTARSYAAAVGALLIDVDDPDFVAPPRPEPEQAPCTHCHGPIVPGSGRNGLCGGCRMRRRKTGRLPQAAPSV
ncbi:hypothetical protein AB0D67_32530 [Streptosporangium sp. NPDC048047]|uniref:hypothetical protein n=1 Tax=Streptosporangium sp. NPDC048047 TaxID=3155748 RepID=UPI003439F56E